LLLKDLVDLEFLTARSINQARKEAYLWCSDTTARLTPAPFLCEAACLSMDKHGLPVPVAGQARQRRQPLACPGPAVAFLLSRHAARTMNGDASANGHAQRSISASSSFYSMFQPSVVGEHTGLSTVRPSVDPSSFLVTVCIAVLVMERQHFAFCLSGKARQRLHLHLHSMSKLPVDPGPGSWNVPVHCRHCTALAPVLLSLKYHRYYYCW